MTVEKENQSKNSKKNKIMKALLKISVPLLIIAIAAASFKPKSSENQRDVLILNLLNRVLTEAHYDKINFDDSASAKIFNTFIENVDYGKRYLIKSDLESLEKYRYEIDDEIKNNNFDFYKKVIEIIKQRQQQAERYYNEAITGTFDFSTNETIQTDGKKDNYADDENEMKMNWYNLTKFAVLQKLDDLLEVQENAIKNKDTSYHVMTRNQLDSMATAQIKENYDDWMKRIKNITEKEWMTIFFNSITSVCDPHTEYLPPEDKTNFDIHMSGKFEGIGATLQSKNGYTKVVNIIPGSASARQGELEVGDIITKVGQGDEQPVDILNMELNLVVNKIRGKKGTIVKLTVKKIDGTVKIIAIERDVVIIEETYAKASILTDAKGNRIGYIDLPSFYADFNDNKGRFCSEDMEKEIKNLNKENVDGIIIDLRNNGGGSLGDVVSISGMFIAQGPIVQVKARDQKPEVLNDKNSDIKYNGPLVVLVNSFSASASEIFAAALQDYDRAIIIGSPNTYGKGSVQRILDFDKVVNGYDEFKPLGCIKLTSQKFYRINGGATQLKGVIPDIILPDAYTYIPTGERENHDAMPWDEIPKAKYTLWKHKYNKNRVIKKSLERINNNEYFSLIDQNAKRLKDFNEDTEYSLNLDQYRKYEKGVEQEAKKYDKLDSLTTCIKAQFTKSDKISYDSDTLKIKKYNKWFDALQKDIYIEEAVHVIEDMK